MTKLFIKDFKGFSLVEVLVTATVLVVIGVVISQALTGTFRGNNRSELISVIKLNGQRVLGFIENDIRNAENVICPLTGSSPILTLYNRDGSYIRLIIVPESATPLSNGTILKEVYSFSAPPTTPLDLCNPDPNFDVLSTFPAATRISSHVLLDNNIQSLSAISVKSGTNPGFSVNKTTGYKEVVSVQFDLGTSISSGNSTEKYSFSTSVQLR